MDDAIKNKISTWLGCKAGKSENLDEDIKQRIIEEAFKLFSQFGIKNVTMDEIARQMGASKKTIYQYFDSKEELVYYTTDMQIQTKICQMGNEDENPIKHLFEIIEDGKDLLSKLNPMVFRDLQKHYPKSWQLFIDFNKNHCEVLLKKQIQQGIAMGYFRKDINLDILIALRLIEMELPFNQTYYPSSKFSVSQVMFEMSEHFIYGLCTEKGHQMIQEYKKNKL